MKKSSSASSASNKAIKTIVPLRDRVLIRPLNEAEKEKRSEFGIIMPDTIDKEKPEQGRVVAVGEGRLNDDGELIAVRVKVGDRIVFSAYSPTEIKMDGEEYFILEESSILAVIE